MKVVYSSAISTAFAVTDSVSSHVVAFTAYQFGLLFVSLAALSLFLFKAYNRRRSRAKYTDKTQCLQGIECPTKTNNSKNKLSKKQDGKEARQRLSRKAKKRLRAAANEKKAPLPVPFLTQQPDKDDILKVIEDVSSQHVFVECKEKKATSPKKVRKTREVVLQNITKPVVPVVASTALPDGVKPAPSSKAAVVPQNVQTKKPRRPRRREFTLNDYILRRDMHLDTYVQTYRV